MAVNASSAAPLHPYYPLGVEIVGFLANEWNTFELVSMFAAGCAVIFSITYAILMKLRPNASKSDVSIMMWFVLCGCIHSFFEGYFAYNFTRDVKVKSELFYISKAAIADLIESLADLSGDGSGEGEEEVNSSSSTS